MIDYDDMSVEDLFEVYGHMHGDGVRDAEYPFQLYGGTWAKKLYEIQAIIRRKVVGEASVGVGTVRRAGESPLPDAPQMFVSWETKDGDYYLIPKETP